MRLLNIHCTVERTVVSQLTLWFNPLKTKLRLRYLKTKVVPRSKHFSSLL